VGKRHGLMATRMWLDCVVFAEASVVVKRQWSIAGDEAGIRVGKRGKGWEGWWEEGVTTTRGHDRTPRDVSPTSALETAVHIRKSCQLLASLYDRHGPPRATLPSSLVH
jgi:hypothetical protein